MSTVLLQIKEEISSSFCPQKGIQIGSFTCNSLPPHLFPPLEKLCKDGFCEKKDSNLLCSPEDYFNFYQVLTICCRREMLKENLLDENQVFSSYIPYQSRPHIVRQDFSGQKLQMSRFSYMKWDEGICKIQSPLAHGEMQLLSQETFKLIQLLSKEIRADELYDQTSLSKASVNLFLSYLKEMQVIGLKESETLKQWEFHDLLFHVNSRKGRRNGPSGGTYRFKGIIDAPPSIKPPMSETTIALFKPDLEKLKEEECSFTEVLEKRASIREYSGVITAKQLGEFLYRSARVKEIQKSEIQDLSKRVCPGGGAIHELEIYLVIHKCSGLEPGLYHYRPLEHTLEEIKKPCAELERLLNDAKTATRKTEFPQVLFLISAKFQRLAWKYQAIAYAVMLKNTGVLMQTMYLVATAMNLAPSGVGCGNSELFAQVTDNDYYKETTIGEFILGAKSS